MNDDRQIEELLQWRMRCAEDEAPPPPRARALLEAIRPWWEVWPERCGTFLDRLAAIELAPGHAMVAPGESRAGHPVPVLDIRDGAEHERMARIHYFSMRDGSLRLRFVIEAPGVPEDGELEVTFVSDGAEPLFAANAVLVGGGEYRIDAPLPEALASAWAGLRVTDRMPFRFLLGPAGAKS